MTHEDFARSFVFLVKFPSTVSNLNFLMKNPRSAACLFLLIVGLTNGAYAQMIASFTPASPFLSGLPGGTTISGQTFTADISGTAGLVTVLAQRAGAAPTSITFQLRSVSAGLPTSSILGSVTVPGASLSGSLANFSADFSSQNIFLTGGEQYAITLSGTGLFGLGGVADAYAGGAQVQSTGGAFFLFAPARDLGFSVAAAPAAAVPEPSTYGWVAALLLAGVVCVRRIRVTGAC